MIVTMFSSQNAFLLPFLIIATAFFFCHCNGHFHHIMVVLYFIAHSSFSRFSRHIAIRSYHHTFFWYMVVASLEYIDILIIFHFIILRHLPLFIYFLFIADLFSDEIQFSCRPFSMDIISFASCRRRRLVTILSLRRRWRMELSLDDYYFFFSSSSIY